MGFVAHVADPLPRSEPRCLGGFIRERSVTRDIRGDTAHILVVLGDDRAEGGFITGSGSREHVCPLSVGHPRHYPHTS